LLTKTSTTTKGFDKVLTRFYKDLDETFIKAEIKNPNVSLNAGLQKALASITMRPSMTSS